MKKTKTLYICPFRIVMGIWSKNESEKWFEKRRVEFAKIDADPNYMPK